MQLASTTRVADLARAQARENEQRVLAEAALVGERRVAIARVAMIALFVFTNEIMPRFFGGRVFDLPEFLTGFAWAVFAIFTLLVLRRAKPDATRARWVPIVLPVIDFGVITFLAIRDYLADGQVSPAMGTVAFAILLTFSVARLSVYHVWISTALACGFFLGAEFAYDMLETRATFFVASGFIALGIIIGMTNIAVRKMFGDLRRRDELTRFLPDAVAQRVLEQGGESLGPIQREVTILFSDIRGFTALSESKNPREVFDFLDHYFGAMVQIVKGHDGVVNKFLGDGLLAFWGAPDEDPRHAEGAVNAALDMRRTIDDVNRERASEGEPPLAIGIGIHTGIVTAGMLGSSGQSEYTVIGDVVNVASRIESLTKSHGVDLLVSESTWEQCSDRFEGERLAEETIRGRGEPVTLYAISGDRPA